MPRAPLAESEPHAAGKKVYNANGCFRCHSMGEDQGGPPLPPMPPMPKGAPPFPGGPPKGGPPGGPMMPNKGPDLAKVARKPGRNAEWFIAFVTDPKKENPDSRM